MTYEEVAQRRAASDPWGSRAAQTFDHEAWCGGWGATMSRLSQGAAVGFLVTNTDRFHPAHEACVYRE